MRLFYVAALYQDDGATLDDLREAATTSAYLLFALYCSAPPALFIFLQSWS